MEAIVKERSSRIQRINYYVSMLKRSQPEVLSRGNFLRVICFALLVTVAFYSCEKNPNYEDSKNNSKTVSGTIFGECATWDEVRVSFDREETWVATTPIQNEKFSLILPKPDEKLLVTISDYAFPQEIIISDKTAKIFIYVLFRAFKGSTKSREPLLLLGKSDKGNCVVEWRYINKDVNITGSFTTEEGDNFVYDVKMKKGWNVWLSYETKTLNEYGKWTGKWTMTYEIGEIGDIPVGAKWYETPISFD